MTSNEHSGVLLQACGTVFCIGVQDSKKIKSEEPYFELLTTELCATDDRVFNVSRFLPSIRLASSACLVLFL